MNTVPKVPREPLAAEIPEKFDISESMTKLFDSGAARFAEVQKKSIDIAAQQSADILDAWKKAIRRVPGTPGLALLEVFGSGIERSFEIQRSMVDLYLDQSRAVTELMKDRTTAASGSGETLVKSVQKAVERAVNTHRKTLDHAAAQTNAAFDAVRKEFRFEGTPADAAADSIQKGVNAIVEAQKDLLEVATR